MNPAAALPLDVTPSGLLRFLGDPAVFEVAEALGRKPSTADDLAGLLKRSRFLVAMVLSGLRACALVESAPGKNAEAYRLRDRGLVALLRGARKLAAPAKSTAPKAKNAKKRRKKR